MEGIPSTPEGKIEMTDREILHDKAVKTLDALSEQIEMLPLREQVLFLKEQLQNIAREAHNEDRILAEMLAARIAVMEASLHAHEVAERAAMVAA